MAAVDNPILRTEILKVVSTYSCFPEHDDMVSFFTNPMNNQAMVDAQSFYGVPPANTSAYHSGLGLFGKWHDFCDREPMGKFYQFAKLSVQYPSYPSNDQTNCQKIKDSLVKLKNALTNVSEKNEDLKKSITIAYSDKISEYSNLYANMTCDTYIANQAKIKATSATIDNTLNTITGGNSYIKYGLIAAVAYFGFVYIKRIVKGESK
jgi:hypothetical protein